MKKLALLLAIILVISMPLTVSATTRALSIRPSLTFEGRVATCHVLVVGNNTSEHIEVTMKLMDDTFCLASWSADGYGYVLMEQNANVIRGRTYDLVIEVTMNGVVKPPVSQSGTCN